MSSSTSSAMDLTLTYYLTKAHLGSLALEPEYNASITVARAAAQDAKLLQSQTKVISVAKISALAALNLATSPVGFRDRLLYLPAYYHFVSVNCRHELRKAYSVLTIPARCPSSCLAIALVSCSCSFSASHATFWPGRRKVKLL